MALMTVMVFEAVRYFKIKECTFFCIHDGIAHLVDCDFYMHWETRHVMWLALLWFSLYSVGTKCAVSSMYVCTWLLVVVMNYYLGILETKKVTTTYHIKDIIICHRSLTN